MVYRPEVVDAFDTLGVTPDVDEAVACRAYKKLALLHHPDRNHGDRASTARFQQIGAAWNICQAHYENPMSSELRDFGGPARYTPFWDLYPEDLEDFFEQMMQEVFMNGRFQRRSRRSFSGIGGARFQPRGYGGESLNGGIRSQQTGPIGSQSSHPSNVDVQKKEKEKFKKRMQEFEREVEAENREIEKAAREIKIAEDRRVSARVNAFESARSGDSSTVQRIVEEHQIDVNGPERAPKNPKKPQPEKYDTLLHTAASHCDEDLVSFLIEKGALLTALNKADLTPFHTSILAGNTQVTRFFLNRRAKSQEGCHPSKAAPDGRTPLQLAVAGDNPSMVELLLKDATVHDVERLWEQPLLPTTMKSILETKKGFVPSEVEHNGAPMSRKARQKLEAQRKLISEREAKEKRLADERVRAEENARKKQERREQRAAEGESKPVTQREVSKVEHKIFTDEGLRPAVDKEAHKKVEGESLFMKGVDHQQREVEEKAQRGTVGLQTHETAKVEMGQQGKHKLHRERGERHSGARTREQERSEEEGKDCNNYTTLTREVIGSQEMHNRIKVNLQAEEQQRKAEIEVPNKAKKAEADAAAKRLVTLARLQAQAEEMQRNRRAAVVEDKDEKYTSTMRKRAEQSARDKARHQKAKAEREKLATANTTEIPTLSPPEVVDNIKLKKKRLPKLPVADTPLTQSSLLRLPLTPTFVTSQPSFQFMGHDHAEHQGTLPQITAFISPPVAPESLQTCAIPDDLFRYEGPPGFENKLDDYSELYTPSGEVERGSPRGHASRGRGRGRGWRGRGRGRGRGRNQRSGSSHENQ